MQNIDSNSSILFKPEFNLFENFQKCHLTKEPIDDQSWIILNVIRNSILINQSDFNHETEAFHLIFSYFGSILVLVRSNSNVALL